MRLQIAIDMVDTAGLMDLTSKVWKIVDIIEVGTPVIMLEGLGAVRKLKQRFPTATILADTKIADGAGLETGYACDAGADIVTVLAVSDDQTVRGCIEEAHHHGRQVLVDLINVSDVIKRAQEIDAMGADYICVHTASDVQSTERNPIADLKKISHVVKNAKIACAGGINETTINTIMENSPEIIIIGSAITNADDPAAAASRYKALMQGTRHV